MGSRRCALPNMTGKQLFVPVMFAADSPFALYLLLFSFSSYVLLFGYVAAILRANGDSCGEQVHQLQFLPLTPPCIGVLFIVLAHNIFLLSSFSVSLPCVLSGLFSVLADSGQG